MKLKSLKNINIENKTVLYRAPYDILLKEVNGVLEVSDDMRLVATLPTLRHLIESKCKIVILTYVGRPDGKIVENLRTTLHAKKLSELLGQNVFKIDDCIGDEVEEKISSLKSGEILMLENVRFHQEEILDDDNFAQKLCLGKDLIVFDGFPQAHRRHSSTTGILRHLPSVAGFYLEKEVAMLSSLLENPKHPFTVIIGGAKISDKVDVITNLMPQVDTFLLGGSVANVFLQAKFSDQGFSFMEDVFVDSKNREKNNVVEDARKILTQAENLNKKIILPKDLIIAKDNLSKIINVGEEKIDVGWLPFDIGPKTRQEFGDLLKQSVLVFINGPLGKFEEERFSNGTKEIFSILSNLKEINNCETITAGGETINASKTYGKLENYSHLSLAGGATLEFLSGKKLPALLPLLE